MLQAQQHQSPQCQQPHKLMFTQAQLLEKQQVPQQLLLQQQLQQQQQQQQQGQRSAPPKEYRHGHVPKNVDLAEEFKNSNQTRPPTTLMIRNIPNRYTQNELILELEALGFAG